MKSLSALVFVVFTVLENGCHQPVTQINGPSESREGVKVELVSVACQRRNDDPETGDTIDIDMKVAVTNGSDRNVQFHPNRLRLIDSSARAPLRNNSPIPIGKGEKRIAQVHFLDDSGVTCTEHMKLDPADSLTLGDPIHVAPIGFIAED